ncbi:MAG: 2-oxoglutarate ferredoxin oxidoreductase subunit alpha, partial [Planctomycetaceae bacterium]
ELPMVIIDVQRGGPSTGLPTKTEQSDLLLAMFGRNGESPIPILAASTPGDCFELIQEALRIAVDFMTPVIFLSDGYIANGAEPWRIPKVEDLKPVKYSHPTEFNGNGVFLPYKRDENLVRPWALPGTPALQHRIGGLEKSDITGNVDYSAPNHQHMTNTREAKIAGIAKFIPDQTVEGPETGDLLVLSWGGTYGSVRTAVRQAMADGKKVAHAHMRYMNPMPKNMGALLKKYKKVLVPELNNGQLRFLIRNNYLVDAVGLNKVEGKPFLVSEINQAIQKLLEE